MSSQSTSTTRLRKADDVSSAAGHLSHVAITTAVATLIGLGTTYAVVLLAWAIGGDEAISDNVIGFSAAFIGLAGLLTSFAAMVLAWVARSRWQRPPLLWLPLGLFPALIAILLTVELFFAE